MSNTRLFANSGGHFLPFQDFSIHPRFSYIPDIVEPDLLQPLWPYNLKGI